MSDKRRAEIGKISEEMKKRAERIRGSMREPAPRPSGGESENYRAHIWVPAMAAEHFAMTHRPTLLAKIAGTQMRIKGVRPEREKTTRFNKIMIDELFDDINVMVDHLWDHMDGVRTKASRREEK